MMHKRNKLQIIKQKKAMATFEVIGYAILAIVVVIVAVIIFTKLSGGSSKTLDKFSDTTGKNTDDCVANPSSCDPFAQKTTAPIQTPLGNNIENTLNFNSILYA